MKTTQKKVKPGKAVRELKNLRTNDRGKQNAERRCCCRCCRCCRCF